LRLQGNKRSDEKKKGNEEDQIKAILEKRRIKQGCGAPQPRPFPGPPLPPHDFAAEFWKVMQMMIT